jgi:hypothetical protein
MNRNSRADSRIGIASFSQRKKPFREGEEPFEFAGPIPTGLLPCRREIVPGQEFSAKADEKAGERLGQLQPAQGCDHRPHQTPGGRRAGVGSFIPDGFLDRLK